MRSSILLATTLAYLCQSVTAAVGVVGKPAGFAAAATGGGSATPQYPKDVAELKTWLTDSTPRVIVLEKEYNFIGSEGKVTEQGCRPDSNKCPGKGGQDAINGANWCTNGNSGAGLNPISVTYDKAGVSGINVGSNKSIIGIGSKGVIRGKGLRMANGVKNVIIQNIHITELNPQYIWGGDGIIMAGTDLIWIDHVKVSLVGRQMLVANGAANKRITISNSEFDGNTAWSASCDAHHYWAIYFNGPADFVTLAGNYIHHTSGRSPKLAGKTLLHAVNNVWEENSGHAFDIAAGNKVVAEGNTFSNVKTTLLENKGNLFTSPSTSANAACKATLGHNCQANVLTKSGAFSASDSSVLSAFKGYSVAGAVAASSNVKFTAGVGKI